MSGQSGQSFTTSAAIVNGSVVLKDRAGMLRWASHVGDGVALVVEVKELKDTRSGRQNRTLWGPVYDQILTALMLKAGYRKDEAHAPLSLDDMRPAEKSRMKNLVHYGLLAECFGYAACPITRRMVPAKTSSELTVSEMNDYFEWLEVYLSEEHGIVLEMPDEFRQKSGAA